MIGGKVAIYFQGARNNGCNFYRIRQPGRKFLELDLLPCALSWELPLIEDQTVWIDQADVLISQNGASEKYLDYVLDNKKKKRFVFDYDDDIFDVSCYNPSYRQHGVSEVEVDLEDGTRMKLWEDGKNGFDLMENQKRLFVFSQMLKAADMVTTPSPILAGLFKSRGAKNVRVLRNLLDLSVWYPVKIQKDEFVRIGYQGGWSHYEDWFEIKEAMAKVMRLYPKVLFVIMGQAYGGVMKELPKERTVNHPWADIETYPWVFKTYGIDIGIAPLAGGVFNSCKSEVKWEEYSALEIPCVASNRAPYSMVMEHGKTGLLASNKDEWFDYLSALVEDVQMRKRLGEAARKKIEKDYSLDEKIGGYKNAFNSMFGMERILSVLR